MPHFETPFAGNMLDRKLSPEEVYRALRFAIAAEYEAIQLYEQIAEATTDASVKAVMKDIAKEEIVHAGEFMSVLKKLNPTEAELYNKGDEEATELMEGTSLRTAGILNDLKTLLKSLGGIAKNIILNMKPAPSSEDAAATTLEIISKYGKPIIEESLDKLLHSATVSRTASLMPEKDLAALLSAVSTLIEKGEEKKIEKARWLTEWVKELIKKRKSVFANISGIIDQLDSIATEVLPEEPEISLSLNRVCEELERKFGKTASCRKNKTKILIRV